MPSIEAEIKLPVPNNSATSGGICNSKDRRKKKKLNTIRIVERTPKQYTGALYPTNLLEEKEKFLYHGILPQFKLKSSTSEGNLLVKKPLKKVSSQYIKQATKILELVKENYGTGDELILEAFGERIDAQAASLSLTKYLNDNSLDGQMGIYFSSDLDCNARMMWHGPNVKLNKPEARRHTLIIKNSPDNQYMSEKGIICLANHEIGTHYMRAVNDGLQPWFSDRKAFGLRGHSTHDFRKTEEGLAALNTILQAKVRYLFGPALIYYVATAAETMTFKELFQHLEQYVKDPGRRWHYVMRVKRHLPDPNDLGSMGKDQCYFEGAMEILKDIDNLDIELLYSGALCLDETARVKRLARLDCLKLPKFMANAEAYKQQLRWIGYINGVLPKPQPRNTRAKRLMALRSQQGPRLGLRESRSQKTSRNRRFSESQNSADNIILIDDTVCKKEKESVVEQKLGNITPSSCHDQTVATNTRPNTVATTPTDSGCILQKISSRLNFHDDLVKRVEAKLSCATLTLRESQKIVYCGVKGKAGLATNLSPRPTDPSYAGLHSTSTEGRFSPRKKDAGQYTVHSRPPTQELREL